MAADSQGRTGRFDDLVGYEDDVAQHGEHVLLHAADHLAVDERLAGRVLDLELDAPGLAHQLHLEILVQVENSFALSVSLPELSTASAHLRNSGYRPPARESSSFSISAGRDSRDCRAARSAHPRSRE